MKFTSFLLPVCIFILNVTPVHSHHGRSNFIYDETVTIEGKVIKMNWRNPHVYLDVQTTKVNKQTEVWLIESGTPVALKRQGWSKESIKTGDNVVVVGNPNRDPEKHHMLLDHVIREDGETFYLSHRLRPTSDEIPALLQESTSANQPAVTPSRDFSGIWGRNPTSGVDTGYAFFKPPMHWSFTPLAEAQLAQFNELDNPWFDCMERGLPLLSLYPYYLRWTRFEDRIEIISQQSNLVRTLYLNQSTHPEQIELSHAGHSIAHIDDDGSLVVDTIGFPDFAKWGLAAGVDASGQKWLRERYTLSEDGLSMAVSITIEDPVYLTEPVTINGSDRKVADDPFEPYECDIEASRRHLNKGSQL